jgi:hypothetical protein
VDPVLGPEVVEGQSRLPVLDELGHSLWPLGEVPGEAIHRPLGVFIVLGVQISRRARRAAACTEAGRAFRMLATLSSNGSPERSGGRSTRETDRSILAEHAPDDRGIAIPHASKERSHAPRHDNIQACGIGASRSTISPPKLDWISRNC